MAEGKQENIEQKTVLAVYAALALMLAAFLIPSVSAAVMATILFTGTMAAAYTIRHRAAPDGFTARHMTYIIRTVWRSSLMAMFTTALAAVYVLMNYDPEPIRECVGDIEDPAEIFNDIEYCMSGFMDANHNLFMIGAAIAGTPVAAYTLWRLCRGISAAVKGLTVEKQPM